MHCDAIGHTTKPTPSDSVMLFSALPDLSHAIGLRVTDWSVQLQDGLKYERTVKKKLTKKSLQQN